MEYIMEEKQERVLAYTLATVIDESTLDNIAGGAAGRFPIPSVQLTGDIGNADAIFDSQ
jgi:hypothetical protein